MYFCIMHTIQLKMRYATEEHYIGKIIRITANKYL